MQVIRREISGKSKAIREFADSNENVLVSIANHHNNTSNPLSALLVLCIQARCSVPSSMNSIFFMESLRTINLLGEKQKHDNGALVDAHGEIILLAGSVTSIALLLGEEKCLLSPLQSILEWFDVSPVVLHPLHAMLMQCYLAAKLYAQAHKIARKRIVIEVQPADTFLKHDDYAHYLYYCGIASLNMRDFSLCQWYLQQVILMPSHAILSVQISAYKKSFLVGLINSGCVPKFLIDSGAATLRYAKEHPSLKAYRELDTIFKPAKLIDLKVFLQENIATFKTDQNLGLVEELLLSHVHRSVKKVAATYMKLSLEDFSQLVGFPSVTEAEAILQRMTSEGLIRASIHKGSNFVNFGAPSRPMRNELTTIAMSASTSTSEIIGISNTVHELLNKTIASREYLQERLIP
jgi:COP9 signalosome complex subunit 3